jgi:hypothetical protein
MTATETTTRWAVQKRVANTDQWRTVARAATRAEAVEMARAVIGGVSTGVRICDSHAEYEAAQPILICGC